MLRTLLIAALACSADAFGKKKTSKEGAAALRDELDLEVETHRAQADAMGGARDYEMENLARRKAGDINDAELGMENLKHAMNDPSAMAEVAELMKDPENVQAVQKMMADPTFQAQARQMAAQMPDMSKMMNDPNMMAKVQNMMKDPDVMRKAKAMASAMYGGGAGGAAGGMGGMGGMGGGAASELERLRAENAALKGQMGI